MSASSEWHGTRWQFHLVGLFAGPHSLGKPSLHCAYAARSLGCSAHRRRLFADQDREGLARDLSWSSRNSTVTVWERFFWT